MIRETIFFIFFLAFFWLIVFSWFSFSKEKNAENLLAAISFAIAQIYISGIFLSLFSAKTGLNFVALNTIISVTLFIFAPHKSFKLPKFSVSKVFSFLVILFMIYVFFLSFFFPPSGTDDFGYRLPVVWENIRAKGIALINKDCDPRMAFPQVPYSIFETYILISGSDRFLDITNIIFLIICGLSVYSVSRQLGGDKNTSLYSSLFVFITPVFVGQLKSNYVDLAFASFFLSSFVFQLKALKNKARTKDIVAMSLYMGFLIGTKYTGLMFLPAFELSLLMQKNFRLFILGNLIAIFIPAPWYIINTIRFGFPIYPEPFSELGKRIYPQGENIFNMKTLFSRYIKISAAFLKYDNLELSYHKGFGLLFWLISLPSFIIFLLKNKKEKKFMAYISICVFVPLLYLLWSIIPTIHVQARFLMWFVALTFCFVLEKRIVAISYLIFLLQFATNFLKMKNQDQPLLDLSMIITTAKEKPECALYDRYFIKYSPWFQHFHKVSTAIQIITEKKGRVGIKCVSGEREIACPFLFYGPIKNWKTNDFSSCIKSVSSPDIIIAFGEEKEIQKDFKLLFTESTKDARGREYTFKFFVRKDIELDEKEFSCLR